MMVCGLMNIANKDAGACLMRWSETGNSAPEWVAISEERLSRVKWAYFAPVRSLTYCMDAMNVKNIRDIDYFVMDWIGMKRLINTNPAYRKLEADYIKSKLDIPPEKVVFVESHHLAHAASAYYPSGFEEAAVLIVDGVGSDMETSSLYHARGCDITLLERGRFYGLGHLYEIVSRNLLGFGLGEEGKTMGLAPFGRRVQTRVLHCQGRYDGLDIDHSQFLDRLPERAIRQAGLVPCPERRRVTEDYWARIAFDVQEELERALLHLARYAADRTGSPNLCLAGGAALNCVANSVVLGAGIFRRLFVQPAASDAGVPYGLALLGYHQIGKGKIRGAPRVYTGISYARTEITELLRMFDIPWRNASNREVARLLAEGAIGGWLTGGSEYGPRALGHRSILADPRDREMKQRLNAKVKHREPYRPFAPSVLREYAAEYFELETESPYMLLAPRVRDRMAEKIPAIVHVDQTARVQTVSPDDCPVYRDLLVEFHKLTGVPVLVNTSFNDNGEPIVETPLDALLCFMRTDMDFLVMEGALVEKPAVRARAPSLVKSLSEYADQLLLEQYTRALNRCCVGYRVDEMARYLAQEDVKGRYHASYAAMDRLEGKLWDWLNQKTRVAVICDEEHRRLLSNMKLYRQLNVVATLLVDDERAAIEDCDLTVVDRADSVLILLFNMAFRLQAKLGETIRGEAYTPYQTFDRKLTRSVVVPDGGGPRNDFTNLVTVSNEARRDREWNAFFRRLPQITEEPGR